jgi:hypothetical protein
VNHSKLIGLIAIALFTVAASSLAFAEGVDPAPTPPEISIQKALAQIARKPDHVPYYYNALAMAYARRARETSRRCVLSKGRAERRQGARNFTQ